MRRADLLTALAVVLIWGLNFVVIDVGLRALPPLLFVALRFLFTALPAVFFVPRPQVGWRTVVAVGALGCIGQFGFLFVAMAHGLPAGLSSVVIQSQALFTLVFAVLLIHEVITARRVLGILVAAGGMGVIAVSRGQTVPLSAMGLALCGGASWGMANVVTRAARPPRPFSLLVYSALVAPLPLLVLSLLTEGGRTDLHSVEHVDVQTLWSLAFVVVAATVVGFGLWYRLLGAYESTVVAPYALLVPVVGLAAAWLFSDEVPSWGELLGSGLTLAGVVVVTTTRTVSPHRAAPAPLEVLTAEGR